MKEIELPEATEYIESFSKAGKLVGNGNGMQYLGGILNIQFVEHGTVSLNGDINGDNFYIVYSWGDGDSIYSELDLRGH